MKSLVFAQMMDRGDHMDSGDGWWWIMGVGLLVIIALVVVVVLALQGSKGKNATSPPSESTRRSAEDVLAERFARGEIDESEYRRRRDALRE